MEQKKVSKYLLYAISEIFLVVIGIYIAIQFNNWNEGKKNESVNKNNIIVLIESLEKDSVYFEDLINQISKDNATLNEFNRRLDQPSATVDTLIKIVRYEFRPNIRITQFFNDVAYYSMVQSGEINLLAKDLRQEIFALYSLHLDLKEANDLHFEHYVVLMGELNSKYIRSGANFSSGPIAKANWKNVDMVNLALAFNPVMSSKRNHYRQTFSRIENVLEKTAAMLVKLRKAMDD